MHYIAFLSCKGLLFCKKMQPPPVTPEFKTSDVVNVMSALSLFIEHLIKAIPADKQIGQLIKFSDEIKGLTKSNTAWKGRYEPEGFFSLDKQAVEELKQALSNVSIDDIDKLNSIANMVDSNSGLSVLLLKNSYLHKHIQNRDKVVPVGDNVHVSWCRVPVSKQDAEWAQFCNLVPEQMKVLTTFLNELKCSAATLEMTP